MAMLFLWLRRLGLLLMMGSALALSISYRSGKIGPEDYPDSGAGGIHQPWQAHDAHDWLRLAQQAETSHDLALAKTLALNALETDVSNGRVAAKLASILQRQGQTQPAEDLATLAGQLAGAESSTQAYLAAFWESVGKPDKKLAAMSVLMTRVGGMQHTLFPQLQAWWQNAATRHLFTPYIAQPPTWWPAFFSYLLNTPETSPEELADLYQQQQASGHPLPEAQTNQYIAYLTNRQQWREVRQVWQAALPADEASLTGLVHDGGFEGSQHNSGFGWFFTPNTLISIKQQATFDTQGERSLRLILRDAQHLNVQHVWQRLALPPGQYTWRFRYRIDRMSTLKGLQWRIRCVADEQQVLAESAVLRDVTPWKALQARIKIPADCPVQLLRLEASSPRLHEQVFAGDLWFDAMEISPDAP